MKTNQTILSSITKTIGSILILLSAIVMLLVFFDADNQLPLIMVENRWFILSLGSFIVLLARLKIDNKQRETTSLRPQTKNKVLFLGFFKGTLTNEQIIELIEKLKFGFKNVLFWTIWIMIIVLLILKVVRL